MRLGPPETASPRSFRRWRSLELRCEGLRIERSTPSRFQLACSALTPRMAAPNRHKPPVVEGGPELFHEQVANGHALPRDDVMPYFPASRSAAATADERSFTIERCGDAKHLLLGLRPALLLDTFRGRPASFFTPQPV